MSEDERLLYYSTEGIGLRFVLKIELKKITPNDTDDALIIRETFSHIISNITFNV